MRDQPSPAAGNAPPGEPGSGAAAAGSGSRTRLPDTRSSITHKFNINGYEGYLIVGLYGDGRPGEVFLKMSKQGSTVRGLTDAIGLLTSLALQHGVRIDELANKFDSVQFEPSGWTTNPDIGYAGSVVDYVFRWLGREFSSDYRQHHPPRRARHAENKADRRGERDHPEPPAGEP